MHMSYVIYNCIQANIISLICSTEHICMQFLHYIHTYRCIFTWIYVYTLYIGSVIHWTRQIKELLNAQEAMEQADTSGPLEEIEFWNVRCEDLSGLTTQLDKPGVLRVCKILEKAKSSYLKQFNKLARLIQVCHK